MEDNNSINNSNFAFDSQISEYRKLQREKYNRCEVEKIKLENPIIKPLQPEPLKKTLSTVKPKVKPIPKPVLEPAVRPPIPQSAPQALISSPMEAILNTPIDTSFSLSPPQPPNFSNDTESEISAILGNIESYTTLIASYQRRLKTDSKDTHSVLKSEIADYEQKILNLRKRLRLLLY